MSEATEKKAEAKAPEKAPEKKADPFRRQAALAILAGYVQKNGGFGGAADVRETFMRQVWDYADSFLAAETAGPLPPERPYNALAQPAPRGRRVAPNDEWGVIVGDQRKRGFVTRGEAEAYAAGREGARVVQISGPEIDARMAVA